MKETGVAREPDLPINEKKLATESRIKWLKYHQPGLLINPT